MQQTIFHIWNFLVIENFSGLATILTIGGAIYLYLRAKRESKQQIATLLVSDIRNADSALKIIRDSISAPVKTIPELTVLPENNWKKFSYLFSRDLDEDEINLINKYFSNLERINYIVDQHNNLFLLQISSRMNALQFSNMSIISSSKSEEEAKKAVDELDSKFGSGNISNSPYEPKGFYTNLERYLPEIPNILTSSAGKKLKKISNPENIHVFKNISKLRP